MIVIRYINLTSKRFVKKFHIRRFLAILAWTRHKRQHCCSAVISQIPACARSPPAGRTARAAQAGLTEWAGGPVGRLVWLVGSSAFSRDVRSLKEANLYEEKLTDCSRKENTSKWCQNNKIKISKQCVHGEKPVKWSLKSDQNLSDHLKCCFIVIFKVIFLKLV